MNVERTATRVCGVCVWGGEAVRSSTMDEPVPRVCACVRVVMRSNLGCLAKERLGVLSMEDDCYVLYLHTDGLK